ncbi:9848_t:CDS:2 [Diversispora eburnea]|uniref:9848_t:CDS:1 n=1 Tax=Diversispora eburnea TaxID=1213867 RepID=A0A9N9CAC7_9GLOM|nr:9848_t:CDS:2 [Diversispora eburnea]
MCPFPDCGKSIEILEKFITAEMDLRRDLESSTSSLRNNNLKSKTTDIDEESNKRPIEVVIEEAITIQDKLFNKKAKPTKLLDREKSLNLKKLIDKLMSKYKLPQIKEIVEENIPGGYSTNFLYFFRKIDYAESKNEVTNRDVISSYFDLGEALYK